MIKTIDERIDELRGHLERLQADVDMLTPSTDDATLESLLTLCEHADDDIRELQFSPEQGEMSEVLELSLAHRARKNFITSMLLMRNPRRYFNDDVWSRDYMGRLQISQKNPVENPLSARESLAVLEEGRHRLGSMAFVYDLAQGEYHRGFRCGVCGRFQDSRCWSDC